MPTKRYFNWKLALVCVIGLVVLAVTALTMRQWQRGRRAERGLALGNKAYDQHNWEQAATHLGNYLAVVRDDVPVLLKYAQAQLNIRPLKRSNVQQAIAAYRTALRADKGNSQAALKLAGIYLELGRPGEAELIAVRCLEEQKITDRQNQIPELRGTLALALAGQRKFDQAITELKAVIAEYPDRIPAYETLGRLAEQRPDDFSQPAQFWFDEAVKNNPSGAAAFIARAAYHLRQTNRPKALADLEQAEQMDLSDPPTRLRLAEQLIGADALDRARKHLEAVYAAEPDNPSLWRIWARLALKSNSKPQMTKIAQTGLNELSAQPWDFMPTAAELYIRSDQLDRAAGCIAELRQKDIAPATTAFLEGLVAERKADGYEAVKCWYRAMQLGNKSARVRLALAAALSRLGDRQSALRQLRTLVSEQPNLSQARLNLARLLLETGRIAEAAEQARLAAQISANSFNAALLHIQTQMQLLAQSRTDKDARPWRQLEQRLLTLEKNSDNALPVKLLQLQLAERRSQFDKARQLLTEIKNSHPSDETVALAEVELLTAQKKTDRAILKLYDLVSTFGESARPAEFLADLLAGQERFAECEKVLSDALTRIDQPAARRNLALRLVGLYRRLNNHQQCCKMLNSLTEQFPNELSLQRELLKCEDVTADPARAQQIVDRIKTIEGQDGWQWRYEQAKLWFTQENFEAGYPQIIPLLKENLSANPDDQTSRMFLAAVYERADKLQLAILTYRDALNRSPEDIRIIVPAVAALYKANEYDTADEILRYAPSDKLLHPELKKLQLRSYLRRGQMSSASEILDDLLADDPDNRAIRLAVALFKMRQNKFAEAERLLNKLKTEQPNSLPVTVAQVELNIRQGKAAEALLLCDEVVSSSEDARAYVLRAKTLLSLGQPDRAAEDLDRAVAAEPNSVDVWVARSDFHRLQGRLDEAADDIQNAVYLAPANLQIQKRAIPLLLTSPSPDKVRQGKTILDEALTAEPRDIDLRLHKARSQLAEQTAPARQQAATILQKITEDRPNLTEPWVLLAEIAFRQGQSAKAIDIALRGLMHQPDNKSLLLLKARSEAAISAPLAIPTLKAMRELDPNDTNLVMLLAETYVTAGHPEEAVNLLNTHLTSRTGMPGERNVRIALAIALHKNGRSSQASERFDSLLASAPDDSAPLLAQARLLTEDRLFDTLKQKTTAWYQSHPEDTETPTAVAAILATSDDNQARRTAEELLRMVLDAQSDCTEALSTLALLLQMTGRSAAAAELYQQLLTLQPHNAIAINNLAWILCEDQKKYQQALELAQQGLKEPPPYIDINYINLIDTRGMAYYRLGEYHKAVRDFNQCLKLYPPETKAAVSSHFHLGRVLTRLGRKAEALEILKRALKLNTQLTGLSQKDLAETQRLIENLSQGV